MECASCPRLFVPSDDLDTKIAELANTGDDDNSGTLHLTDEVDVVFLISFTHKKPEATRDKISFYKRWNKLY